MGAFTKFVTAIDFSEMSKDVLQSALDLASRSPGATLHVLHVVPNPLQQSWTIEAVGFDFARLERDLVADADGRLGALIAAAGPAGASAKPIVLVGPAAETIVRYATELPADVIVMGTHGYGPFKRFILGSVAERVLRQATCPVLTIPQTSLKAAVADTEPAAPTRR